jgi:hypothetical protein
MKRLLLACLLLLPVGLPAQAPPAALPTPESVFGFQAGADFRWLRTSSAWMKRAIA